MDFNSDNGAFSTAPAEADAFETDFSIEGNLGRALSTILNFLAEEIIHIIVILSWFWSDLHILIESIECLIHFSWSPLEFSKLQYQLY